MSDSATDRSSRDGGGRRRAVLVALVAVLVIGFALRLWYAAVELHAGRWWDERFNVANILTIVASGEFVPKNHYYGTVSYLPQLLIVDVLDTLAESLDLPALTMIGDRGFTPLAYLVCRGVQVVWGTLSLWLLFRIGRRLISPWGGVIAAFTLSVTPYHLHFSAEMKADIALLATSLLAFEAAMTLAERPRYRRYALAGSLVGVATGAKLNGATMAVPLLVAGRRRWTQWRTSVGWAVAAAAALTTFLVFNPFPREIVADLSFNIHHYEQFATDSGLGVMTGMLRQLFAWNFHGLVVGTISTLGALLVLWRLARSSLRGVPATWWLMTVSYPFVYLVIYTLVTDRVKVNHDLLVLPFTSLLATYAVVELARSVRHRIDSRGSRILAISGAVLVALLLLWRPTAYVYRNTVLSTTGARAVDWIAVADGESARSPRPDDAHDVGTGPIFAERGTGVCRAARRVMDCRAVDSLLQLPEDRLRTAAGLVFEDDHLGTGRAGYVQLLALPDTELRRIEPRLFRRRGPRLVAVRPQRSDAHAVTVEPSGRPSPTPPHR